MKKVLIILLCLVLSCFALIGCTPKDEKPADEEIKTEETLLDWEDCEIGYQIPVYPSIQFDYQIEEGFVVHMNSITATLVAKNEIKEGDLITKTFYPYTIEFKSNGYVSSDYAGTTIDIRINTNIVSYSIKCTIGEDGNFSGTEQYNFTTQQEFIFHNISRYQ